MSDLKVGDACPQCGKEAELYSRIVGYLRPVTAWNPGKKAEFADRLEYDRGFASRKIDAHQKSE
jgi:ribonucleoside-triphosphate reductase